MNNQRDAKIAAIDDALQEIDGGDAFINKGEVGELPSILGDDELPKQVVDCHFRNSSGTMFATDYRLVFVAKSMLELRVADFTYGRITSIESYRSLLSASFTMILDGTHEEASRVSKVRIDAFVNWVRIKIAEQQRLPTAPLPAPSLSIADELEKLADLCDRGILTEAEFNDQKSRLLR